MNPKPKSDKNTVPQEPYVRFEHKNVENIENTKNKKTNICASDTLTENPPFSMVQLNNKTILDTKFKSRLAAELYKNLRKKNINVCRINSNLMFVKVPYLQASFHFKPFDQVEIRPLNFSDKKHFFWIGTVFAETFEELMRKACRLKVIHSVDLKKHFGIEYAPITATGGR